jgi:hypothetical protein
MVRRASWALVLLWLLLPASAQAAASKPAVTTGAAASVTQSTVTLTGTVDPNGAATTYFFQFGTTTLYGLQTSAGTVTGTKPHHVAIAVAGLAPFTRYHYRLVARNAKGLTKGHDRSFKTLKQPLGLTLAASANPVGFDRPLTIGGTLTGTGNANREVVLQSNPFPYTRGFLNATNPQLTNSAGQFSFTLASVPLNTQFRVLMPNVPSVVSPIIAEGVKPAITTHIRVRGTLVRLSGSVRPLIVGAPVSIQKRRHHRWVTIARAITHRASATRASYRRRVRQHRGGRYRVVVGSIGSYAPAVGHSRRVHVR